MTAPADVAAPSPPHHHERLGGRRLAPAVPAAGAVVAAGVAFGRVFGFSHIGVTLVVSSVIGAAGGAGGRVLLLAPEGDRRNDRAAGPTEPGPAGGLQGRPGPAGGLQGRPGPAGGLQGRPGPAWLTDPSTAAAGRTGAGNRARLKAAALVVAATLLAAVVTAGAWASPRAGIGRSFPKGIGALFGGWSKILTTSVPVPPSADRLPVLAGVVALAMAVTVITATRPHTGVASLVPAAAVLLIALALGVGGPGSIVAVTVAPALLAGAYLLVVSRPTDDGVAWVPPARTAAAAVTGVVVIAVALAVGSSWPLATARAPFNLRSSLNPPLDLGSTPNPLALLPSRKAAGATVMFRASVDPAWLANPTDWRLVSLDVFTGSGWTTDAHARRSGTVLAVPPGIDPSRLGPVTTVRVTLRGLTGPWVPTTGVPTGVHPADLAYDPATSILVAAPTGTPSSGASRTFTVSGHLPAPSRQALDTAGVTVSSANAALTQVPSCLPPGLTRLATTAAGTVARPDQQAVAVEEALKTRSGFAVDPTASPGSSCGRLGQFVAARRGTVEQFATAFVLMARAVGLPARLAVGFTPGAIDRAADAARATVTVHGSDATVWPEVELAGVGWVPFDPVPAGTAHGGGGGATTTSTTNQAQSGLNAVRGTVASSPSSTPNGYHGPGTTVPHRPSSGSGSWWVALIVVVVVASPAGLVAARLGHRRRRRSRRRSSSQPPHDRIVGAWAELLDALAAFDATVATLTPTEVATVASSVLAGGSGGGGSGGGGSGGSSGGSPGGGRSGGGSAAVSELAGLVDLAVYAGAGDDDDAVRAWACSDTAVAALQGAVPAGLRLRHLVTGRPRRRLPPPAAAATAARDVPAGNEGVAPALVGVAGDEGRR